MRQEGRRKKEGRRGEEKGKSFLNQGIFQECELKIFSKSEREMEARKLIDRRVFVLFF